MMKFLLLALGTLLYPALLQAQVPITIDILTDTYGYEGYWQLVPDGSACGSNTIASGGNNAVGCTGGGDQNQTPGGYAGNQTFTSGPYDLTEGATYSLIAIDDWGDGGIHYNVRANGYLIGEFASTGASNTFSFVAALPAALDLGLSDLSNPKYAFADQSITVSGMLRNHGTTTITTMDLNYTINGGTPIVAPMTGLNIAAGDMYAFQHSTPWTPTQTGTYDLDVWASNLNGDADQVPENDHALLQEVINAPIPNIIDQYLYSTPSFTTVGSSSDQVSAPRDLDFHQDLARNELWVINKGTENSGGSTVTFFDAGGPAMTHQYKQDGNAWHFMSLPTAIAMSDNGNFGISSGVYDANHDGGMPFSGPSLWSSDMSIYAQPSGGNGSHLDMLHESPYSQGMASETLNRFWVVDGNLGDIVMYDFKNPHVPGGSDHADAVVHRFDAFTITKDPNNNVVSHCVLDHSTDWLYVVDFGGQRVLRLAINSGTVGAPPTFGPHEGMAEYETITGATWEPVITTGLVQPAGIEVIGDRLLVSDNATGDILVYDLNSAPPFTQVGTIATGAPGIMGIKVGPDGRLWYVNTPDNEVVRIDPAISAGVHESTVVTMSAHPNPTTGIVYLAGLSAVDRNATLDVLDITGSIVLSLPVSTASNGIDLSGLSNGVYGVRIREYLRSTSRIVVNH
ncbi:MAG: T9SS type A sorting domain-containing protein [Flavobacteriales bacterium]